MTATSTSSVPPANFDRSGIRDAALIEEVAALLKQERAVVVQDTMLQERGNAADANSSKILDNRFSGQGRKRIRTRVKVERTGNRQGDIRVDIQLRDRGPEVSEVIHGQRFGRRIGIDRDRKRRRSRQHLIRADEHIVVETDGGVRHPVAFPIRSDAP